MTTAPRKHQRGCPCELCPKVELRCGCIANVRLCERARRLWDAVARAYKAGNRAHQAAECNAWDCPHFEEHARAVAKYEAHFAPAAPGRAEQASLLEVVPMA